MAKLLFVCLPGFEHFLAPVMRHFGSLYQIRQLAYTTLESAQEALAWAEIVWLEWANRPAAELTAGEHLRGKAVICRIHNYEALNGEVTRVNWRKVDHAIFIASHVQSLACRSAADLAGYPRQHVIPNGLEPERFAFVKRRPGPRLAFVGDIGHRKGLLLLAQAFKALSEQNSELTLHLAGNAQDLRILAYLEHFFALHGLSQRVFYAGWVEDIPGWLADKDYLLNCCPWESQGLAMMEAMLCGIKPLIHHFVGAEAIYPRELLWSSLDDLLRIYHSDYTSQAYRDFVCRHFAAADKHRQLEQVLAICRSAAGD